jgi:hypothetical protein
LYIQQKPGTDAMIFYIFSPTKSLKVWRFLLKTKLNYAKNFIITLVLEKNANLHRKINRGFMFLLAFHKLFQFWKIPSTRCGISCYW